MARPVSIVNPRQRVRQVVLVSAERANRVLLGSGPNKRESFGFPLRNPVRWQQDLMSAGASF